MIADLLLLVAGVSAGVWLTVKAWQRYRDHRAEQRGRLILMRRLNSEDR